MSPVDPTSAEDALTVHLNKTRLPKGCQAIHNCVLKTGPRAYKTASLLIFGEADSDQVSKRELRVQSWTASSLEGAIDFHKADHSWHCENDEIEKLLAFLSGKVPTPGRYRRVRASSPANEIIDAIESGNASAQDLSAIVHALLEKPESIEALARSRTGDVLASTVRLGRHRKTLDDLSTLLEDPTVTETKLQRVLEQDWWIFGGRFIERAQRRSLTVLDQIDVPLIRSDGVLHIVELKGARIPRLVEEYRNHLVVGPDVNRAVGQVMNYLRALDEQRDVILNSLGIDCRRAFATVVIGDPRFVSGIDSHLAEETLRTYNAHLARVEVITYLDLLRDSRGAVALHTQHSGEES